MSVREIIETCYAAYAARDLEGAMAPFADHVKFDWPQDGAPAQFCGCCEGREAMAARLADLASAYEYLSFTPLEIIVDGNSAAARVEMKLKSRATGETVTNVSAQFWRFEGDKCVEFTELYDTGLIARHMG